MTVAESSTTRSDADAVGWDPPDGTGPSVLYLSVDGPVADLYREHLPVGWRFAALRSRTDVDEHVAAVREADVIVHTDTPIAPEALEAAQRLRLVQRPGVGLDALDLPALRARGVRVAVCPTGTPEAVAEHAVMLMLAAGRHLIEMHHDVTERGRWPKWEYRPRSIGLSGATVGIVGFGRIGQAVADRVLAFGSEVLVHRRDGGEVPGRWPDGRVHPVATLEELFSRSDVVTLHCPLVPETRGMVDAALLAHLRPHAVLVNTARGAVVVEDDLVEALRDGRFSAGIDCFVQEPPPSDHPLFDLPNVVVTPHVGAGTRTAQVVKARAVYANVARLLTGAPLEHEVM